jgi:hypothetical protein
MAGGIAIGGAVTVSGTGAIVVAGGGASLTGAGTVRLTNNLIGGAISTASLTNAIRLEGGGDIGGGKLALTNTASGLIESFGAILLTVDVGGHTIVNAGTLESTIGGGLTTKSAVANTGLILVHGGTLTLDKAVTGAGTVRIDSGRLDALGAFTENVTFTGATGVLELAKSQAYAGAVTGLSLTGKSSLDLLDIKFISAAKTTATFVDNGSKTGGVLTVTDGTHTAHITLVGDYAGRTFTAGSDGSGGTKVIDPSPAAGAAAMVAAIAGFSTGPACAAMISGPAPPWRAASLLAAQLDGHA